MPIQLLQRLGGQALGQFNKLAKDRTFRNAFVTAIAITITSDNEVEDSELEHLHDLLIETPELQAFDPEVLYNEILAKVPDAKSRTARMGLLREVSKLSTKPVEAEMLIGFCVSMANQDGAMEPGESRAIAQMARMLRLNPADYDLEVTSA